MEAAAVTWVIGPFQIRPIFYGPGSFKLTEVSIVIGFFCKNICVAVLAFVRDATGGCSQNPHREKVAKVSVSTPREVHSAGQVVNQQQLKLKCSNSFAALETPRNDELREDHEKFFVSLPTNVSTLPESMLGPIGIES
eukprot:g69850.t1